MRSQGFCLCALRVECLVAVGVVGKVWEWLERCESGWQDVRVVGKT